MNEAAPTQQFPQLRMEIRGLAERASSGSGSVPLSRYGLRTFRPGDEDAWLALLQSGDFGAWNRTRLDLMLKHPHVKVPPDGIFFATLDDRPVGTASTYFHPVDQGIDPELGWVVVDPRHRGHGLGLLVCQAVPGVCGAARLRPRLLADRRLPPPGHQDVPTPRLRAGADRREPPRALGRHPPPTRQRVGPALTGLPIGLPLSLARERGAAG